MMAKEFWQQVSDSHHVEAASLSSSVSMSPRESPPVLATLWQPRAPYGLSIWECSGRRVRLRSLRCRKHRKHSVWCRSAFTRPPRYLNRARRVWHSKQTCRGVLASRPRRRKRELRSIIPPLQGRPHPHPAGRKLATVPEPGRDGRFNASGRPRNRQFLEAECPRNSPLP